MKNPAGGAGLNSRPSLLFAAALRLTNLLMPVQWSALRDVRRPAVVHNIAAAERTKTVTAKQVVSNGLGARMTDGMAILNQARQRGNDERGFQRMSQHISTPIRTLSRQVMDV
jgi:hypothetical protein